MNAECELYRHFDKDGRLLYVGISVCAVTRLAQHEQLGAEWYKKIVRIEIERFPTRLDAMRAELDAIKNEGPLYNRATEKDGERTPRKLQEEIERAALVEECLNLNIQVNPKWRINILKNVLIFRPKCDEEYEMANSTIRSLTRDNRFSYPKR